ncbi:cytochrome c1 [Paremcibacter congregatus]|uniref:cytochrome c1 n=1 Tax=Paremcibacter congregatus TaxID=2043170 RepID=UPI0030EE3A95|tara:strand:+ start:5471 stop:6307 length:837 start_codon:yes stop_codon:yes gene_type:complete
MLYTIKKIGLMAVTATVMVVGGTAVSAAAGDSAYDLKKNEWPHAGPFGTFDKAALQRGLQVYKEVCSSCHSLKMVAFRNLTDLGYSVDEVKAFAAEYEFPAGLDDEGEVKYRKGLPQDYFPSPFGSEEEARESNNGALPPDFSLLGKSREHLSMFTPWNSIYGEDYIVGILTTYHEEAPHGVEMAEGMYFNEAFSGNQIAMAPPLFDELVEYADGTEATKEQMAKDVATFMYWAAEPKMEERKKMGLKVIIYMTLLTILLYFVNKRVWKRVKKGEDLV